MDGKTLHGARNLDRRARDLLGVIDHHARVVLGQVDVDGQTNEVRREAACRIPIQLGGTRKAVLGFDLRYSRQRSDHGFRGCRYEERCPGLGQCGLSRSV